jgi:hypothetical protein
MKVMPLKDMFGPYVTTWLREGSLEAFAFLFFLLIFCSLPECNYLAQKKMMEWTQKAFQRDVDLNFPPIAKDKVGEENRQCEIKEEGLIFLLRMLNIVAALWIHSKVSIRFFFYQSRSLTLSLLPDVRIVKAMQFLGKIKMFDLTPQKIAFSGIVGEVVDWYLQAMFDNVVTKIDQVSSVAN